MGAGIILKGVMKGISVVETLLKNPTVQRYGSAIMKKAGGEQILGHLESIKPAFNNMSIISGNNGISASTKLLINDKVQLADKIIKKGSSIVGGMASLNWGNLAINGINMGVTPTSMLVPEKKIETLNTEVIQMNSNIDSIMQEIIEVKAIVKGLQEKAISDEYAKASELVKNTFLYIKALRIDTYSDSLRREVERHINATSSFIEKNIKNYTNPDSTIIISLDEILSLFYAYVSLLKAYVSAVQLNDNKLISYTEHQECMKMLCSKTMITTIQDVYRNSTKSYMAPQDLASIVALYKEIMSEQIGEVKSQKQILELIDHNEYNRINEQLQESRTSEEIVFVQYAS